MVSSLSMVCVPIPPPRTSGLNKFALRATFPRHWESSIPTPPSSRRTVLLGQNLRVWLLYREFGRVGCGVFPGVVWGGLC